jgi:hypothetical protein
MKNLKQMEEILNAFALQKLNQEDTIHLNWSIKSNNIETVIRNLPPSKAQDLGFWGRILSDLWRKANSNILQTSPWNRKGRNTIHLIHWSQCYIIPKRARKQQQKELQTHLIDEYRWKNLSQILANQIQQQDLDQIP